MQTSLIIAAGGDGIRFRKALPASKRRHFKQYPSKLFMPLKGRAVLAHTLSAFRDISEIREILITCPPETLAQMKKMVAGCEGLAAKTRVVKGGKTRASSVLNALRQTKVKAGWVMVHDGARPLVSGLMVKRLLRSVSQYDGAILARRVIPTIKQVRGRTKLIQRTIDRDSLFEAETPQLVRRSLLMKAYSQKGALQATDEASLLEPLGARVRVVLHENWNPKITTFNDLALVDAYLSRSQREETRSGFGRDIHRLVAGRKLYLGGVHIPFEKGPLGHSDGDALLHAVADAMLGVLGEGDIGDWFSDRSAKNKNIRSERIVRRILAAAKKKEWQVVHVDSVIQLERPRLGTYKQKMKLEIARMLELKPEAVSIKAKSAEGLGPVGEGAAVSCEALVTMKRTIQ